MQETNRIVQTLEFRLREILEILGNFFWEQILENWHRLDDRNLESLFRHYSDRRICERHEVLCNYNVLASRLIDEVGDCGSRISRRNREGDTFSADDPKLDGGIRDCV